MGTQRLWTALGANSRVHLQIIKQILTKPAGCNSEDLRRELKTFLLFVVHLQNEFLGRIIIERLRSDWKVVA